MHQIHLSGSILVHELPGFSFPSAYFTSSLAYSTTISYLEIPHVTKLLIIPLWVRLLVVYQLPFFSFSFGKKDFPISAWHLAAHQKLNFMPPI